MTADGTGPPPLPSVVVQVDVARARSMVSGPALALMIVAGLGVLIRLLVLLVRTLGFGAAMLAMPQARGGEIVALTAVGVGAALTFVAVAANAFVVFGAMKMRNLRAYPLALAAAIVSMVPCSCCFLPSLVVGIWALVVLLDKNVQAAFQRT